MKRLDSISGTLAMIVILVFVGLFTFRTHETAKAIDHFLTPSVVEAQVSSQDPCNSGLRQFYVINITANQQIATGATGRNVYICMIQIAANSGADNVALVEGTGSTCATGTVGMAGGNTAVLGWNLQQYASWTNGGSGYWAYRTATAGDNVCLIVGSATQVSGSVQFVVI